MEIVKLLNQNNAILFLLLFSRFSGLMAFFPFFSHVNIPVSVKTALVFYLSILFFPLSSLGHINLDMGSLILAVLSELTLGFIAGAALSIVFAGVALAGEQISMVMGFSMATVLDPQTGVNSPIVSNFLTLLAVLVLLAFDGHHYMLLFFSKTIGTLSFGEFYPKDFVYGYFVKAVKDMFIFGFILAFPIIALSLLVDLVFGMLMKTMPQFNLLVIGYPVKIFFSVFVLTAVLASMMLLFRKEFLEVFRFLSSLIS
ncbi:MAG: flagellar type III secretion system protein FliR [Epsilonproteobacteria bacterium]|nr:flagellar type III secretion system protein FliR [Campylobacterota bacterium]